MSNDQPITTGDAARLLGVSEAAVRGFENKGLLPATKTASGMRLFKLVDVERLATQRAQRQKQRTAR